MTLNDKEYHALAEQLMMEVEDQLDDSDIDVDCESSSGILTITFPDFSKIIINKQAPLQQVWVATKFNGHHFNYAEGQWIDERTGAEFWQFMSEAATKQGNLNVTLVGGEHE